jgi:hypothetical protein
MAHRRRWSGIRCSDARGVRVLDRDSATRSSWDLDYSAGGLGLWWVDGDGLYDGFLSRKKAQNEEASLAAMSVTACFVNDRELSPK